MDDSLSLSSLSLVASCQRGEGGREGGREGEREEKRKGGREGGRKGGKNSIFVFL